MIVRRTWLLLALVVAATGAAGWWYWHSDNAAPQSAAQSGGGAPAAAKSNRRGAGGQAVAVETASVERGEFPVIVRTLGWVESPAIVSVRSRVDSQVIEQHVTDGQMVKQGDLLFVLDSRNFQVQLQSNRAALARDEALHARAAADLRRKQDLLARGASTQQQVDQATADERAAAAAMEADKAAIAATELSLSYTRITAPISGRAGAVQVSPGNLVSGGSGASGTTGTLLTITQISPIQASFSLSERYIAKVQAAMSGKTPPQVRLYAGGAEQPVATAPLTFIDSSVDIQSGTIVAKARLDNADGKLWPGQYVDVDVVIETLRNVALVPTVAVQTGLRGRYVYVVRPNQTVETRVVSVAAADAAHTVVSAGLQPGETVVVEGQQSLSDGVKVREPGAEKKPEPGGPRTSAARSPATGSID